MTARSVFLPLVGRAHADAATAVERFSARHERGLPGEGRYRELVPLERPGPGEQMAFEVDLDRCSGCKACVTACHSLNGLDPDETWRAVGVLHGGSELRPIQLSVTTACHHCLDPACQSGCPVGAYEKDAETGAVRHLDDQCIGCRYCTFTCPYEVPRFNRRLGIVRKCDLCVGRLREREAPACVQGCPNGAIAIRIVSRRQVMEDAQTDAFLPGTPSPALTLPTTSYRSSRPLPRNLLPADFFSLRPSDNHGPLVLMLVLTQLAAGAFLLDGIVGGLVGRAGSEVRATVALGVALLALSASVLHLGRPWLAFRAVLGLRSSWLSREIVAFGLFAALAAACGARAWLAPPAPTASETPDLLAAAAGLAGLLGVGSSVMVYAATRRRFWTAPATAARFFGTTAVLGLGLALGERSLAAVPDRAVLEPLARALALAAGAKLAFELSILGHLGDRRHTDLRRSARLLVGALRPTAVARLAAGLAGGFVAPLALLSALAASERGMVALLGTAAFVLSLGGELLERTLFFRAMSSARMPGSIG
jgi:Fe-S-cluster-containing dehydrogenase component/DMSO reductase anchor subunit